MHKIPQEKKKELLYSLTKDDFEVQTFRAGGKGGQNQNKVESGVRIIHKASGAVGESRNHRDQPQNKKEAFRRLIETARFQAWHKIETARQRMNLAERRELLRKVDEMMDERFLKIETY